MRRPFSVEAIILPVSILRRLSALDIISVFVNDVCA